MKLCGLGDCCLQVHWVDAMAEPDIIPLAETSASCQVFVQTIFQRSDQRDEKATGS